MANDSCVWPARLRASEFKVAKLEAYKSGISGFVQLFTLESKGHVVFFPQVTFAPLDDDRSISLEIWHSLPIECQSKVHVIIDELTPSEIKGMIGLMDIFVGTRMHSNIFALSQNVPCVAIAYEPKTKSIMKQFGLQEQVIDIKDVTATALQAKTQYVMANKIRLREQISSHRQRIEHQAMSGGGLIATLIRSRSTHPVNILDEMPEETARK